MRDDKTLFPVVDGDDGATILGFAADETAAVRIGDREFPDGCSRAEFTFDRVELANGETLLGHKWIAYQTGSPAEIAYLES